MIVKQLKSSEHLRTRGLYEQVFPEDTKEFVDYYYSEMANHNQIWAIEREESEEILAMLHLNPYQIQVGNDVTNCNYIVAVATKESERRQGHMGKLLLRTLEEMYEQKMPFTYLMPAAEGIYSPYDFVTVTNQKHYEYTGQMMGTEFEEIAPGTIQEYATEEDCKELALFANRQLSKEYDVFTYRTESYFQQMLHELECQNGGIVLVKEKDTLVGYFMVTHEDKIVIREPVFAKGYDLPLMVKEQPKIMIRVVYLKALLAQMKAKEGTEAVVEIYDPILTGNTGTYYLTMSHGTMQVEKVTDVVDEKSAISVGDLAKMIFEQERVLLNEIV